MNERVRDIILRERKVYPPSFFIRFYPMVCESASGVKIKDVEGREYIDLNASWAVASLGYGNNEIIEAFLNIYKKLTALSLTTFSHEITLTLAEKLISITPGNYEKMVFFGHSGSDANEAVYKMLSRFRDRFRILSFLGSYHGQTMGSYSMSGHPALSQLAGFPNVVKVPYPYCYRCPFGLSYPACGIQCLEYIDKVILKTVAPPETISGAILEPVQSDGGDIVPPSKFVKGLKDLCDRYGILLISDEVKVGLGRTGKLWGIELHEVIPDCITVGKPLGSGLPISAAIVPRNLAENSPPHLFTLAGHPAIASAALATIDTILKRGLHERAGSLGQYMIKRLKEIQERHEIVGDVRGVGMIAGLELVRDRRTKEPARMEAAKVVYRAWEKGVITAYVGIYSNVIELTPPLTIGREEIDKGLDMLEEAISDVEKGRVADDVVKEFAGW